VIIAFWVEINQPIYSMQIEYTFEVNYADAKIYLF